MHPNGEITMPRQPAFIVSPSSNSSAIAADTTHTIVAATEIQDINGDWDGTSTFTAPVAGTYLFTHQINVASFDHDNNYSACFILAGGRRYTTWMNPSGAFAVDGGYFFVGAAIADMDVSDTCVFQFRNDQGAQQPVINQEFTFLQGWLLG